MAEIFEYRGVSDLVYAEVTCDDNSTATGHGYVTGPVKKLAGVATLSKAANSNSGVTTLPNRPTTPMDASALAGTLICFSRHRASAPKIGIDRRFRSNTAVKVLTPWAYKFLVIRAIQPYKQALTTVIK